MAKVVSLDWCDDEVRETLPWDSQQYVTVRRLNQAEMRKRASIAISRVRLGADLDGEGAEMQVRLDELRAFEWEHCIVDFQFVDAEGKTYRYGKPFDNKHVLDHVSGDLAEFIDALIDRVNKSGSAAETEVKDLLGNSAAPSDPTSGGVPAGA